MPFLSDNRKYLISKNGAVLAAPNMHNTFQILDIDYFLIPNFSINARYPSRSVFFKYARSPLL